MGFFPQVVDLTGDGVEDIVSGSYMGEVLMYKGVKGGGFMPADTLKEATPNTRENYDEFIYSNPTYADFNGDSLLDAFVGGRCGVRVMLNEGTKDNPFFGRRTQLLTVSGDVVSSTEKQVVGDKVVDYKTFVTFVDWDNDGVGDLLTANSNYDGLKCYAPLLFHKGVMLKGEHRFEVGVPLIKQWGKEKVLPGSSLNLTVVDYNGNGVNDILLGVKMKRMNDTDKPNFYFEYQFDNDIIKQMLMNERNRIFREYIHASYSERADMLDEIEERLSQYQDYLPSDSYKYSGYVILIEGKR